MIKIRSGWHEDIVGLRQRHPKDSNTGLQHASRIAIGAETTYRSAPKIRQVN